LRLSKRGSARARQWLYFAVLRLVQQSGVRPWYEAKKARNEDDARVAVVAVMRKLAVALDHVGVDNQEFKPRRLFGRIRTRGGNPAEQPSRTRSKRKAEDVQARGFWERRWERIAGESRRGHGCWAGVTATLDCSSVKGR